MRASRPLSRAHNWPSARAAAVVALTAAAALASCNETFRIPGLPPAAAAARTAELFESVADRFSDVLPSPRYDVARVRFAQSALTPSRVFDDTAVWDGETRTSPSSRVLYVGGEMAGGRYHLDIRPSLASLPPAVHPGDTRHTIALERVAPSIYRWDTNVDMALGTLTADEMSAALLALFRSADARSERELRDNYRAAFPRGAAAFGRGFSVDTLRVTPAGAGAASTTSVAITVGFHPETMRAAFPSLAHYVDKYIGSAKYHLSLADRSGVVLLDILGHDRTLTLRYRLAHGALVSLAGEPRPWPDSLELTSDVLLKIKHFSVGFHDLHTSFIIERAPHERAVAILARREPQWDMPLGSEHLLRTPLSHPFAGEGASFRLTLRDSAGGGAQTIFGRRTRLEVQESAILHVLGGLTSHALGDLDTRVEAEEDRFFKEGFTALRADLVPLAARWRTDE